MEEAAREFFTEARILGEAALRVMGLAVFICVLGL